MTQSTDMSNDGKPKEFRDAEVTSGKTLPDQKQPAEEVPAMIVDLGDSADTHHQSGLPG